MRRTFSLWRLYLQNSFGLANLRQGLGKKRERVKILLFLLLIPSFVGFLTIIYQFFAGIYQTLPAGQEAAGLTVAFLFATALVFLFGIFYLLSVFFFSKDTQRLLPLPLEPEEIVGAKFALVLVHEYITLLPLLLPAFISWAQLFGEPFFWLRAIVVFFLVPIVPLALAATVGLLVMRLFNLPRNRDAWRAVGILVSLAVAFAIQFFVMRSQSGFTQEELVKLLLAPDGLMNLLARRYPPALWATQFLARGRLVALGMLLLFSLGAVWLVQLAAGKLFLAGALGSDEVSKGKRPQAQMPAKPRGLFRALLWRETVLFVRNPVFLINGILNVIMPPVLVLFFARGSLRQLSEAVPSLYIELIAVGFIAALPVLSVIPGTSISREGRQFWLSRLIPVAPKWQLLAKLAWGSIATLVGGFLSLVVIRILFKLSFPALAGVFVVGFVGSIGVGALAVLIDALWPNLEWTDPQKAMKGNLTGLYGLLLGGMYLLGVGLLAVRLVKAGWGSAAINALLLVIFVGVDLVLWHYLARQASVVYWQEK